MLSKFIYSDNGSLADKTPELDDYYAGTAALTIVAAEDKLYIGSRYPITRKYFKVSTPNSAATSAMSVKYWDGTTWRAATNVIDGSASSGKTFAASGYLSWETDKQYAWVKDDTVVSGSARITGLSATTLYDYYWVQISFSADLTTTLAWAGDLFCSDSDLGAEFPDLVRAAVLGAWTSGKTSWEEQRVVASRLLAQDLKKVWPAGATGVLGPDQLMLPAVAKTAELIFNGLDGREAKATEARKEYDKRLDPRQFVTDSNANGREDPADSGFRVTRLYR
jgi:hypothetical protein